MHRRSSQHAWSVLAALIAVGASSRPVHAADDVWRGVARLDLGAGLAVRDNRNAAGQTQGTTVSLAEATEASWLSARGPHQIWLSFRALQGLSFAPVSGAIIKGPDDTQLSLGYELEALRWLKPFVETSAEAPVFATAEVRGAPTTFVVTRADGSTLRAGGDRIDLTQPLRPLSVRETAGVRFFPARFKFFSLTLDGAFGGGHVVAEGQRALHDDLKTTEVEVVELESSHAVGPELALATWGDADDGRVGYEVRARARLPIASTDVRAAKGLGAFERTEIAVEGRASIRFVPWLTLDYDLKLVRRPLVTDRIGIENTLMLSVRPTGRGIVF